MSERLASELHQAKTDYDLRLRSLRQEHEKVKNGYETRIDLLTTQLTRATAGSGGSESHSAVSEYESSPVTPVTAAALAAVTGKLTPTQAAHRIKYVLDYN